MRPESRHHESRHDGGARSYTHLTYPPFPPLFILADKHTSYAKLMEQYDSMFSPKPPPHHPPPLPAYTKCNCGDASCLVITPPSVCSPPPPYRETEPPITYGRASLHEVRESRDTREASRVPVESSRNSEYDQPNVDEHFRKSLGEKYDMIKCRQENQPPSSVDDHFAKALGQKCFKMVYGNRNDSEAKS